MLSTLREADLSRDATSLRPPSDSHSEQKGYPGEASPPTTPDLTVSPATAGDHPPVVLALSSDGHQAPRQVPDPQDRSSHTHDYTFNFYHGHRKDLIWNVGRTFQLQEFCISKKDS